MLGLPFWSYCVFVPCVNVAALIPISFNGIGLREAVYVLLLQVFHISASNAVGLSLIHFGYLISLGVSGAIMHTFWFDKNNSTSRRSG
jgi:uncharacterized membrane protein YbhN (UPF0104 family)